MTRSQTESVYRRQGKVVPQLLSVLEEPIVHIILEISTEVQSLTPCSNRVTIVTHRNILHIHTDHVDFSQSFTQGELLDGDGQNGKVFISSPL